MNIETKNISLTQTAPIVPIRLGQEAVVVQPASKNVRNQQTNDRAPSNDYQRAARQEAKSVSVDIEQDALEAQQRVAHSGAQAAWPRLVRLIRNVIREMRPFHTQ